MIGGTGGSGTRLVARLCAELGWTMGTFVNGTGDALAFVTFYDRWLPLWWAAGPGGLAAPQRRAMERALRRRVARHLLSMPDARSRWEPGARWGWKNPRSLYLVPFLHDCYPRLRYIQVVRDGRDMAFSENTWPLEKDGPILLSPEEQRLPTPHQSVLIWNRGNLAAAEYGERAMADRFLTLSFEGLCSRPHESLARLMAFLDASDHRPEVLAGLIDPPASIGRWRRADPALGAELTSLARVGLDRFGYLSPPDDPAAPPPNVEP